MKKRLVTGFVIVLLFSVGYCTAAWFWEEQVDYCQILDSPSEAMCEVGTTLLPDSRFGDYGSSTLLELEGRWEFAYLRDIARGDVDVDLRVLTTLFFGSAGLQLPDQLAKIAVDAGWTRRCENGFSFVVRAAPGIYSDIEKIALDVLFMPVSCTIIRAFSPELSGKAGLEIRPGFDRTIMPLVGIAWEAREDIRLEAQLPKSRLVYFMEKDLYAHAALEWRNTSYRLREKGSYDRDMMTIEDFRLSFGLTHRMSDELHITGEIGRCFDRRVEFKEPADSLDDDMGVRSTLLLSVTLGGQF
jgi:hypothetical protein